jgi:catabolite regulation protein CreA
LLLSVWLVRSQETVSGVDYMEAMIPHHSIAILTSERAGIEDPRVQELAGEIIEAQRREIKEMEWLIEDIRTNGVAETEEAANARPVRIFLELQSNLPNLSVSVFYDKRVTMSLVNGS